MTDLKLTATLWLEEGVFCVCCPELDVVTQGTSEAEALTNLKEAVLLFLEEADPGEIRGRLAKNKSTKACASGDIMVGFLALITLRMPYHRAIDQYEWRVGNGKHRVRSAELPVWYKPAGAPESDSVWRAAGQHASGDQNTIIDWDAPPPADFVSDRLSLRRIE